MSIIKSAIKKLKTDKRRTTLNQRVKNRLKTAIKATKKKPTKKNINATYSAIDTAAKKNVIHKNKAARLKSRIYKLVQKSPITTLR